MNGQTRKGEGMIMCYEDRVLDIWSEGKETGLGSRTERERERMS